MKARPRAKFPQFWPETTMATPRSKLNSLVQMRLGLRLQRVAVLSDDSEAEF